MDINPILTYSALQMRSSQANASQSATSAAQAAARERQLAAPIKINRARVEGGLSSYHIVPKNNIPTQGQVQQRMGAGGDVLFRRIKARQGAGGGSRR